MKKRKVFVVDNNPYFKKDGRLMKRQYNFDGELSEPQTVARYSRICETVRNIETGQVTVVVEFEYGNATVRFETSRGNLMKSKIGVLAEQGIDISDRSALDVLENLRITEEKAPLRLVHTYAGYSEVEGQRVYKHAQINGVGSTYVGKLKLGPCGSEDEFRKLLQEHVFGYAPLELALAIGLSAPFSSLLSQAINSNVLLVHFYGNSTTGKTTAARLAVAPFGYPAVGPGGLIKTWNSTANAIQGTLGNTHGLALVMDEISMAASLKSNLIYLLSSGVEKDRLTKDSLMNTPKTWSGTFLSTGEYSWLNKSTKNIGAQVRLLEFGGLPWTKSAEHADLLKAGLLEHYGHLGPQFAEALLKMETEEVMERWKKAKESFLARVDERDEYSERLSDIVAVILATAELGNELLGLSFSIDGISELLHGALMERSDDRDLGKKAYEVLLEEVSKNRAKFECGAKPEKGTELWGKIEAKQGVWTEIAIMKSKTRQILEENGFEDCDTILREWKKRGWLNAEAKKTTRKRAIGGVQYNVHIIKVIEEYRVEPTNVFELSWMQRPLVKTNSSLFDE
ncbi:MAG: DUF927 domain-containing protein [Negativicutes bacterium]|nr:DUF927 domain-containing protein [Negativicutes bacterium]